MQLITQFYRIWKKIERDIYKRISQRKNLRRYFYGKKAKCSKYNTWSCTVGRRIKKDGDGGMMKGVENIFKVGVEYGAQLALDNQKAPSNIDASTIFMLGDQSNNK